MRVYHKILMGLGILLLAGSFFWLYNNHVQPIQATAAENVSGWAWSDNIGWISFNCTDCDSNPDNELSDGVPVGCPAVGSTIKHYGVNLDYLGTKIFSGYAWSSSIGWISFNSGFPVGVPNDLAGCPKASCQAWLDGANDVHGWARALTPIGNPQAGGWDGWISLNCVDTATGCGLSNYKVVLNPATFAFGGWAWGADVLGWISFSNVRLGSLPQPPSATNLAVNQGDYCLMPLVPIFSWTFSDPNLPLDSQSAYQVLVDNNSDFSSPEINTNKVINSGQQYSPPPGLLSYSTTYYWKVTVWDSTDLSATTNGPNFTTPLHRYPNPSFMVIPQWPTKDEVVLFSDNSLCYDNANSSYSCKNGGSISYRWDFSYVSPTFVQDSTKKGNASTTYAALGNYTVRLEITDSSLSPAGVCVTDQVVNVGLPLPFWKEVAP